MSKRHRYSSLDGIRGLAINAVMLWHAAYVLQHSPVSLVISPALLMGAFGVDLFFFLSGFLITGILIETRAAVNRKESFYARRILRIYPVYFLALGSVFWAESHSALIKSLANLQNVTDHAAYVLYFQNFIPLWHHGDFPASIIGHDFLLVALAACGAATLGAIALIGPARDLWFAGPHTAVAGIALFGGAFVGFCVQFEASPLVRMFDVAWLRSFGKYSYGMYVWHFPIYALIQAFLQRKFLVQFPLQTRYALPYTGVLLAASYGAAICSFNGYEQWFLRLKRHFEPSYSVTSQLLEELIRNNAGALSTMMTMQTK